MLLRSSVLGGAGTLSSRPRLCTPPPAPYSSNTQPPPLGTTPSGGAIWNLYGRLVSPSGALAGPERLLSADQPLFPSLAYDGDNYLLGWSVGADRGGSGGIAGAAAADL